jgi:hypothetical protein
MIKHRQYHIAKHQLDFQLEAINETLKIVGERLRPESPAPEWAFFDECKEQKRAVKRALELLEKTPRRKPSLIDRLVVWTYDWAMKDRWNRSANT